ncbi:hypothetical protein O5O45_06950 [Hahella aquimaris]|uniref:hypothetical protein n=1 Tax=Hahella sp. HNIBRBA332 TaxID=3015983 RepID=UPI00273B9C2B|nr:hypothetical protein [Hahella sp. HNIBRBA332]WLQ15653.1 hypothetical protein O5O45_06950 [Hahella sp. HNIBRBA332]
MGGVSNVIYFEHDNPAVAEVLTRILDWRFNGDNSEIEEMLGEFNPKIIDLIRAPHYGHKNLEWLDDFPAIKKFADYELNFDELDKDFRLWLDDFYSYSDALGNGSVTKKRNGYEIFVESNLYVGPFLVAILKLAGATKAKLKQDSLDWHG